MTIRIKARTILAASTGLLLVHACAAPARQEVSSTTVHAIEDVAPVATDASIDTQWKYLLDRYDENGDREISTAEYSREGQSIDRWDRNEDGLLSDADFERTTGDSRQGQGRGEMMRQMRDPMARRMMSRYFQTDDNNEVVTRAEFDAALASYDLNGDGALEASEFRARATSAKVTAPGDDSPMVARFMGDMDPWDTIANAVDRDKSGTMSTMELASFYDKMAAGAGKWDLRAMTGGGGRGRSERGAAPEKTGPSVGTMAPDFTLESPEGEELVRLSSFRGSKPVALIFGSYT